MTNNFRELENELISEYGDPPDQIREDLQQSRGIFQLIGSVTEHLIPKLFQLLASLFSPDQLKPTDRPYNQYPNLDK